MTRMIPGSAPRRGPFPRYRWSDWWVAFTIVAAAACGLDRLRPAHHPRRRPTRARRYRAVRSGWEWGGGAYGAGAALRRRRTQDTAAGDRPAAGRADPEARERAIPEPSAGAVRAGRSEASVSVKARGAFLIRRGSPLSCGGAHRTARWSSEIIGIRVPHLARKSFEVFESRCVRNIAAIDNSIAVSRIACAPASSGPRARGFGSLSSQAA
jgi:hypothetical protein